MRYASCVFPPYTGKTEYTYKLHFDAKPNDYVVVHTPSNGFQVVQIRGISDTVKDKSIAYKWAVSLVDLAAWKQLKAKPQQGAKKRL